MVRKVDTPRQKVPPEFSRLLGNPKLSGDTRVLIEALTDLFNRYNFWDWQIYQRLGGSDDSIADLQTGELFDPGIETTDAELLEALDNEQSMGSIIDLTERLEDIENRFHVEHDLSDRVEDLENVIQFTGDFTEAIEDLENSLQADNDLSERVEDLENKIVVDNDLSERVEELETDIEMIPSQAETRELEIVSITASFTTTGDQIILCNNTSLITVTLNATPQDGERVRVKMRDSAVDVTSADNIDGVATISIVTKFDAPLFIYTDDSGEWGLF